jgi:hypothetical protein
MTGQPPRRQGFALLMVFVMAAVIAIFLYNQLPRVAFEAQRSKEDTLIYRGEEYKRAIQLYVRKIGQYPQSIEQLEGTNGIRFLRKRYVDPMTGKDEWRLVHVGPGGVLTDSVKTVAGQGEEKKPEWNNTFISEGPAMGAVNQQGQAQGVNLALRQRPSDRQGAPGTGQPLPWQGGQQPDAGGEMQAGGPQAYNPPGQVPEPPQEQEEAQAQTPDQPAPFPTGQPQPFPGAQPQPVQPGIPGQGQAAGAANIAPYLPPGVQQPGTIPGNQPQPFQPYQPPQQTQPQPFQPYQPPQMAQPGQQPFQPYQPPQMAQPGQQPFQPYQPVPIGQPGQQQPFQPYQPPQMGQPVQQPFQPYQPPQTGQPGQQPFQPYQPPQTGQPVQPQPFQPYQPQPFQPGQSQPFQPYQPPPFQPGQQQPFQPYQPPQIGQSGQQSPPRQTGGVRQTLPPGVAGTPGTGGVSPGFSGIAGQGGPGQPPLPANNPATKAIWEAITRPRPGGMPGATQQGQTLGAGIAGVASKYEADSIKVYGERQKYNEWEFIYDPKEDMMRMGKMGGLQQQGQQPAQNNPLGQQPGQQPTQQPAQQQSPFGPPAQPPVQPQSPFGPAQTQPRR